MDLVEYEVRKFVGLLLKCNPNVQSLLWLDEEFYLKQTPAGEALISNRHLFGSKQACASYCGYAAAQLQKMGKVAGRGFRGQKREELLTRHGYDTKNAAHCIRLLRMGIEYLRTGTMRVNRAGVDADELLAIKKGAWSMDRVVREAQALFREAKEAERSSRLPDEPDREGAEALLVQILRDGAARNLAGP